MFHPSWKPSRSALWLGIGAALAIWGVLGWARVRDPFERRWFTIRAAGGEKARCVVVRSKTATQPYPVAVYLHGSGGTLQRDGNDLRQLAEMGLAAVGLDYCQTNDAICEAQFAALVRRLQREPWADAQAMAWIGFSLGAEKVTRFWLNHPEMRPPLLVRLGGGWMGEVERSEVRTPNSEAKPGARAVMRSGPPAPNTAPPTLDGGTDGAALLRDTAASGNAARRGRQEVLLVHGRHDGVFPVAEAERMAAAFRAHGVPVELRVCAGLNHGFEPGRGAVFRVVGEDCLTRLRGPEALRHYRSAGVWQSEAWSLWVWWLPALGWMGAWLVWHKPRIRQAEASRANKWVWWTAGGVALLALGMTAVNLVTPRLAVNDATLAIARRCLVQPQEREDFEYLASLACWRGQRVGTLLEHAHLARYNRGLVNWTLEDAFYREFVLPPVVTSGARETLHGRRMLWESLYPRVRREHNVEAAAETVVRHLRERVTIADGEDRPGAVAEIWRRQITNRRGFDRLTVAGLRAVGIAARLNEDVRAELWADGKWQPAPRPVCADWNTTTAPGH